MEYVAPGDIEKRSFEIIEKELGNRVFDEKEKPIIMRAIHTSADFDYADSLVFSENAVDIISAALKNGADIITDTQMAKAGINKRRLSTFGGKVHCFIADRDICSDAIKKGTTRSAASMDKAARLGDGNIFVIGNAPTALIRLNELIEEKKVKPAAVIGVPVGFVNVIYSKELIMKADVPYIVARGRKGGSNIAAAICNAVLYNI